MKRNYSMGFWKSLGKGLWQPVKLVGQATATVGTAVAVGATLGQARGPKKALKKVAKATGKTFMDSDLRHLGETIGLGVATAGTAVAVGATLGLAKGPKKATKKLAKKTGRSFDKTTVVGKAAVVAVAGFGLGAAAAAATNAVNAASAAVSVSAAGTSGAATAVVGMAADGVGATGKPTTPGYVPDPEAKEKRKQPKRPQEESIARDPPPVKTKKPEEKNDSKIPLYPMAAEIDKEMEDYQDKKRTSENPGENSGAPPTSDSQSEATVVNQEKNKVPQDGPVTPLTKEQEDTMQVSSDRFLYELQKTPSDRGISRRNYIGPTSNCRTDKTPVRLVKYFSEYTSRQFRESVCPKWGGGDVFPPGSKYTPKINYGDRMMSHCDSKSVYASEEDLLDDDNWKWVTQDYLKSVEISNASFDKLIENKDLRNRRRIELFKKERNRRWKEEDRVNWHFVDSLRRVKTKTGQRRIFYHGPVYKDRTEKARISLYRYEETNNPRNNVYTFDIPPSRFNVDNIEWKFRGLHGVMRDVYATKEDLVNDSYWSEEWKNEKDTNT